LKLGRKYKRLPIACTRCRKRKIKCSGDKPRCENCSKRGYFCDYKNVMRRSKKEDTGLMEEAFSGEPDKWMASPYASGARDTDNSGLPTKGTESLPSKEHLNGITLSLDPLDSDQRYSQSPHSATYSNLHPNKFYQQQPGFTVSLDFSAPANAVRNGCHVSLL
ncbi:hypothetical protein K469DRAFT_792393, partial [Zopfia rhizophila CBS 207.26]